jgi:DNA-binding transcriptional ArsR family regulator
MLHVNSFDKGQRMGVRILLPEAAAEHVALVYSPALEAVLSLHILVEPKHHPIHHEWVRAARRRLPADMKRLIAGFRFAHTGYLPPVLVPSALGQYPTFEQEVQRLEELGPALGHAILRYFLGAAFSPETAFTDPRTREGLLQQTASFGPATLALARVGFDSPLELACRFVEFLTRYWDEGGFGGEWERIEPKLAETVTCAGRMIAERGFYAWLQGLRPKVRVDEAASCFQIGREVREDITITRRARLVLAPSAFLWPHIGLVYDPPGIVGLGYSAPFATHSTHAGRVDTDSLVTVLEALGDPTRLRVLHLIAQRPRSTQELARLMGLSDAALSKQLRRLTEVGILQPHRDGYYVLYRLVTDPIARLSSNLLALMEQPASSE